MIEEFDGPFLSRVFLIKGIVRLYRLMHNAYDAHCFYFCDFT